MSPAALTVLALVATACSGTSGQVVHAGGPPPRLGPSRFVGSFDAAVGRTPPGTTRLVTNEYATSNPRARDAVRSDRWIVTSGSLFARNGLGWSGVPDGVSPDPQSSRSNDSAVFRMTTRARDFGNVAVLVRFRNLRLVSTPRTPAQDWDGLHLFLRYQGAAQLYYASVNRRDGTVAIKKKVRGGPHSVDGGTYTTLAAGKWPVPYRFWQNAEAVVRNVGHDVVIDVHMDGHLVVAAVDHGQGGRAPITKAGRVGIRADNCEFEVASFVVASL